MYVLHPFLWFLHGTRLVVQQAFFMLHIKFGVPHYTLLDKASMVGFHQARLVENKAPCHLGHATVNILDNDVPTNKEKTNYVHPIWHYFHHLQ
jgi:hypothetical protein